MSVLIDNAIALRILSILVKPFTETEAFGLGIIDAHGRNIIPVSHLNSQQQKESYTYLHRLVFNIKKIINRLPSGESKIRNLAAAMLLVRESVATNAQTVDAALLEKVLTRLADGTVFVEDELLVSKFLGEDMAVNSEADTGNATGGTLGGFSLGGNATGGVAGTDPRLGRKKKKKIVTRGEHHATISD